MPSSPITLCGSLSLHAVSLGATLHAAGYRALGLDFAYVPFAIERDELASALDAMRALKIRGFGVSMPFKLDVIPLLDALDPMAARIGAVNTIVNDAGRLVGYNTDAPGSARALGEAMELADRRVLVLGAGGAARAVVHALADRSMHVAIANRTREKASALADDVNRSQPAHPVRAVDALELDAYDALVNCTSQTMAEYGGASPVASEAIPPNLVVMDIVYKPVQTALVKAAEARGARAVHGGRMLLYQAARQFELYTGRTAPLDAMHAALERALT